MPPVLTVAVVNYETPGLTAACVRSVLAAAPSEPFELMVVDNGSAPATVEQLRAIDGARLVATGVNGGFAAAVNRCVAEADAASDVIVVLNSDTEVASGALDALARGARDGRTGLAAPVLHGADGAIQCSAYDRFPSLWTLWGTLCVPFAALRARLLRSERAGALTPAQHEAGEPARHVTGAAMAIRREAWDATGPFDERFFMYFEETEWQERMTARGWNVALAPAARVRHLHRGGELTAIVPPLVYVDSARTYFRTRGHRDLTVRATLAAALGPTLLMLLLLRPVARLVPSRRAQIEASRAPARRALTHVLRGSTVPRP